MITQALSKDQILTAAKSLPVTPQIMARLHAMLIDSRSGVADIAALIGRDPSLTSRLLVIANSPAFGNGKIGGLEEALRLVGFGEVFRLVGVITSRDIASRSLRCYDYSAQHFGTHNLFTAIVSEMTAERIGLNARSAYTAGLLGTIGMVLLDTIHAATIRDFETYPQSGNENLLQWEKQCFGITHREVNQTLLESWNFPAEIIEAVGPREPDSKYEPRYLRLVELVGSMVRASGHGLGGNRHGFGIRPELLERVNLTMDDANLIIAQAKVAYANFQS